MIVTKFHANWLTFVREISEKHAILVNTFNVTLGIVTCPSILKSNISQSAHYTKNTQDFQ